MAKINHFSTVVVENVEIVRYYMAKSNHFSTMVGENFEILKYEMAKINHFSTMVEEIFEICMSEMALGALESSLKETFQITFSVKNRLSAKKHHIGT